MPPPLIWHRISFRSWVTQSRPLPLPLIVLRETGSVLGTGALAAATALPAILAGLFMGVVIDRFNRRSCSIATDLISACSIAALPVIDHVYGLNLYWFIVLGIVGSIGDLPGLAARAAILPAILRDSGASAERMAGSSQMLRSLAMLAGPALAGTLMAALSGTSVLWVTAGTSLLAAMTTFLIPRRLGQVNGGTGVGQEPRSHACKAVGEGWRILRNNSLLLAISTLGTLSVMAFAALRGIDPASLFHGVAAALIPGLRLVGDRARYADRWSNVCIHRPPGKSPAVVARRADRQHDRFRDDRHTNVDPGHPDRWLRLRCVHRAVYGAVRRAVDRTRPRGARGRVAGIQNALVTGAIPLGILSAAALTELSGVTVAVAAMAGVWALAAATAACSSALRGLSPAVVEPNSVQATETQIHSSPTGAATVRG